MTQSACLATGSFQTFVKSLPGSIAQHERIALRTAQIALEQGDYALVRRLIDREFCTIREGEFTALVGPSGAGKSSLVQAGLTPLTTYSWSVHALTEGALSVGLAGSQVTPLSLDLREYI